MGLSAGAISAAAAVASAGAGIANAAGGSGGSGGKPFTLPKGQQTAYGQDYSNIVNSISPYATGYPGQVIPQFGALASNLTNNPYAAGAQNITNTAANTGLGTVFPQQFAGAGQLQGMGQAAQGYVNPALSNAFNNQYAQALENNPYAPDALSAAQLVNSVGTNWVAPFGYNGMNQLGATAQQAAGLAPQLIQSAFDPQQSLYNRQFQQMQDQTNAINAMYGLSNSPYGAGLAGQAANNFNIGWLNQQLGRQLQGIQGLGSLGGQQESALTAGAQLGIGGLSTDLMAGTAPYAQYTQNAQNALGAQQAGLQNQGLGAQTYGGLTTAAGRGLAGASDLYGAGLGTLGQAATGPYNQYTGNIQTGLGGLNALNQGVSGSFAPAQYAATDIATILGLGNAGQNQAFNQGQVTGNNLGQSLAGLSNWFQSPGAQSLNQLFAPSSNPYDSLVNDQNFAQFLP